MPANSSKNIGAGDYTIGAPANRVDGPLKVQGKARYAAENQFDTKPLIAWQLGAPVASGTLTHIDTTRAEQQTGVHMVITHHNAPAQLPFGEPEDKGRFMQSRALLNDTRIRYAGFPIALVVADTLEQARYAASLIDFDIDADEVDLLEDPNEATVVPEDVDGGYDADASVGNTDQALKQAQSRLDVRYTTPSQVSAAMEPHATIASYDGTTLQVHTSIQVISAAVQCIATTFKLEPDTIEIQSPYVGGGFGSKLGIHNDAILACMATLLLKKPVKMVMTRRQVFHNAPHRGHSTQFMSLGADNQGALQAVQHHSFMPMARDYAFAEGSGVAARINYQAPAIDSQHRVKVVDSPMIDSVRAPGDAIGSLTFESAIDELAHQLGLDPLTFRQQNLALKHPITGADFSTNNLRECLDKGAATFGWHTRKKQQRGSKKTGFGVAVGMRMNLIVPAAASVSIDQHGGLTVDTDMTDIGTGTYTILSQIVADYFALPISQVTVNLGNSRAPASCGSGGSFGASSCGTAVLNACENLAASLCELAGVAMGTEQLNIEGENLVLGEGQTRQQHALATLLSQQENSTLSVTGEAAPDEGNEDYAQYSSAAHFAEVEVDTVTGEVRVLRQHGAFSAGRILNYKTAGSQLKGGMIWGTSYALFEDLQQDKRDGSFINCDFAEYHFAVNRDIGELTIEFIEEPDYKACKLGSKGIGELGITGAGAAIANAVFDATGVRVRDFPVTPDKVMLQL